MERRYFTSYLRLDALEAEPELDPAMAVTC